MVNLLRKKEEISGFVFGQDRRKIIFEKEDTPGNILICGATGSRKTYSIVYPSLMSWKGNVFVIDRDGILYDMAKSFRDEKRMIQIDIDRWKVEGKVLTLDDNLCEKLQDKDIFIKFNVYDRCNHNKLRDLVALFLNYYFDVEKSISIPILFLLDNSEMIAKIEDLSNLMKLDRKNLRICTSWQSIKQLKTIYGDENSKDIIENSLRILFTGHDSINDYQFMIKNSTGHELRPIESYELAVVRMGCKHWEEVNYYLKINPEKLLKKLRLRKKYL